MHDDCRCESSLCDCNFACTGSFDPRFLVWGVGQMCTACVSNMCATGGSCYITLIQED